jgi:hypothetical protein
MAVVSVDYRVDVVLKDMRQPMDHRDIDAAAEAQAAAAEAATAAAETAAAGAAAAAAAEPRCDPPPPAPPAPPAGIDTVLKDMRQHPEDAKVQEKGCNALTSLALDANNRMKIGAGGGVEAIVQAMGGHRGSEGVRREG